ncbi:oxidoreductase [Actinocorallia aurea]
MPSSAGSAGGARTLLRRALRLGITYVEVGAAAGLVREALRPYPRDVVLAATVGAEPGGVRAEVEGLLRVLGTDRIGLVYLAGGAPLESFGVLAELRRAGLIGRLGLCGADVARVADASALGPVAAVRAAFDLAAGDDDVLRLCENEGIAFVASRPLPADGALPARALAVVDDVAARAEATRLQVALAWLLCRSRTTLAAPPLLSADGLRETAGAGLLLDPADLALLDGLRRPSALDGEVLDGGGPHRLRA